MTPELLSRIDAIALKVGTTAERLWSVLIAQARIEMWQDIIWAVALLIAASICGVFAGYAWRKGSYDKEISTATLAIFAFVLLVISVACGMAAFTEGTNPQYWALKEIIGASKCK